MIAWQALFGMTEYDVRLRRILSASTSGDANMLPMTESAQFDADDLHNVN